MRGLHRYIGLVLDETVRRHARMWPPLPLLTQSGSHHADFQNWPGWAGGAGQSDRRLFGLFRSNKSCL